eukprot:Mrub_10018.p1 GENE.Mrub_10018~~Mrub_10018.p1  ORF type:complete len:211 (-),score=28.58 Mrub_10018:78-653(-)
MNKDKIFYTIKEDAKNQKIILEIETQQQLGSGDSGCLVYDGVQNEQPVSFRVLHKLLDAKTFELSQRGLRTSRYFEKSDGLVRMLPAEHYLRDDRLGADGGRPEHLHNEDALQAQDAVEVFKQLSKSLLALYRLGVCHLDIKSLNILYKERDNKIVSMLSDYEAAELSKHECKTKSKSYKIVLTAAGNKIF